MLPPGGAPAAGGDVLNRVESKVGDALGVGGAPAEGEESWLQWLGEGVEDLSAAGLSGVVSQGVPGLLGAPVDLLNASPMLMNLLPGEQGVGPVSDYPVGGSQSIRDLFQMPNDAINAATGSDLSIDYEPQNALERFSKRIGAEVGASAVPVVGALSKAARVGEAGLGELSGLQRHFVEPAVRNPGGLIRREATAAVAAGAGAQAANELVDPGEGDGTLWSDFLGSVGGVGALGLGRAVTGAGGNLIAGATNSPGWMDDIASQSVVDQIINNSSDMADQAAPYMLRGEKPRLDTKGLSDLFRKPTAVEEAVPGYQADIGTRSGDPRLQTFVQDADARSAGAGNTRRAQNNAAVNTRVDEMAPEGDPARFREDLQRGVDDQIASTETEEALARAAFDEAATDVRPRLPNETARGSDIRGGLQGSYDTALDDVSELYRAIEGSDATIDPAALAARFGAVDEGLPLNDRLRFRPAEADVPGRLAPEGEEAASVPLREATAIRSGLSNDIQSARAGGEPRRASIAGKYRGAVDDYLAESLDPGTADAYGAANRARFDVGQRFEEGNTAISQALKRTERGGYQLDDSALPRKFLQPDTGKISDYQGLMREAGQDPAVREAIADQAKADVQPYLDNPERLRAYMADHNIVLSDFPDLRASMERTGTARGTLTEAEKARQTTTRDLTTPGRSPEASYLRYSNDRVSDSVRQVVNDPDPAGAAKRLIDTADTPEARGDLRAAFWEEIKGRGKNSATDSKGNDVWNARKVRDLLKDPKFSAVAKELWADDPEDLENITGLFDALEAATPGKMRAPGSSGTAQSLSGKLDPSLTTTSLASRARSVKRGQLSLGIAVVDVASTWMRNKSAKVQARAIDTLAAQVVNNPGLAADLLDKYNPATYDAFRRMITQKYGVRVGALVQMLDRMNDEEEQEPATEDDEMLEAVDGR